MAGFDSHDGKLHGNRQLVERYDESHGKKSKHMLGKAGGDDGEHQDGDGHEEIKSVVAEHGPAHKIQVQHDHEAKHSTVISHHGEPGHRHEAHFDGEDHHVHAHAHAAHAAGVHDSDELHEAHSEGGEADDEENAEERVHPGIHQEAESFMGEE